MKKTVVVNTVQSTAKTIVIQSKTGETYRNGEPKFDKFKIWINDQDGNPSRAYTQYQKLRPLAGDKLEAEVFEKEASFTNPAGKLINYTDRTINYFYLDNEGNPTKPVDAPQASVSHETPQHEQSATPKDNKVLEERIRVSFEKRDQAIEELASKVIELSEKVSRLESLQIPIVKPKLSASDQRIADALGLVE